MTGSSLYDTYYFLHDHLHSPVAVTNALGYYVFERYEYDAYGDCNILDEDYSRDADQKSDYENPYLFTGRRVDILDNGNLKIMDYRHRYYDTYTGRFLQHDLREYTDSINLYEYVKSNPLSYADPFGLETWSGIITHSKSGFKMNYTASIKSWCGGDCNNIPQYDPPKIESSNLSGLPDKQCYPPTPWGAGPMIKKCSTNYVEVTDILNTVFPCQHSSQYGIKLIVRVTVTHKQKLGWYWVFDYVIGDWFDEDDPIGELKISSFGSDTHAVMIDCCK